jgi:hypothetical protein
MGPALVIPLATGVATGAATAVICIALGEVCKRIDGWLSSITQWLKKNEDKWWAGAAALLMTTASLKS